MSTYVTLAKISLQCHIVRNAATDTHNRGVMATKAAYDKDGNLIVVPSPAAAVRTKAAAEKYNVANWIVCDPNGQNEHQFDNKTRSQAKYEWVKTTGLAYFDARTRKQ